MKNWRLSASLLTLSAVQISGGAAHALEIPLRSDWIANPANHATPAYAWQNDPGLLKHFNVPEVTNFCVPAAIGTAFINQFAYESPPAKNLALKGLSTDANGTRTLNTNQLILDLVKRCKADVKNGTTFDDSVQCVAEFYRESGYSQAKVKMIRPYNHSLAGPGIEHENRRATQKDIESALADGYQVIASIAMIRWDDSSKKWTKIGSHSLNAVGISGNKLHVTNPTRAYTVDGIHPLFDEASIRDADPATSPALPSEYSPILIEGRLLTRPNSLTVLAGLFLLRAQ